jgi:predicted enzyme related to lactoylglutathione lyase
MAIRISETIYFVQDLDTAIKFYTEKVGFKLEQRYDWGFAVVEAPGGNLGLMQESEWEREYPDNNLRPQPRIALQTDDFDGEISRLMSTGVEFGTVNGNPGGRQSVTFNDSDENVVYLWSDPEESME